MMFILNGWKDYGDRVLWEVMIFEFMSMGLNSTLHELCDDVKIMSFGKELR